MPSRFDKATRTTFGTPTQSRKLCNGLRHAVFQLRRTDQLDLQGVTGAWQMLALSIPFWVTFCRSRGEANSLGNRISWVGGHCHNEFESQACGSAQHRPGDPTDRIVLAQLKRLLGGPLTLGVPLGSPRGCSACLQSLACVS
jgi:hypothetical protein